MSFWLKRMETFLESVDQTAATQISSLKTDEPDPQPSHRNDNSSTTYSQPTRSNTLTPSKGKSTTSTTPAPKALDDNDIFKFLNDSDSTPPPSSAQRLTMPAPKPKKELKVTKKTINTTQPTKNTTQSAIQSQKVTSIPPTTILPSTTPPSQEIQQPPKKVTPPSSPKKTEPTKPTLNEKQEIETKRMETQFGDHEEKEKETEKEKEIEDRKEEKEDKVDDAKENVETKQEREETEEKVQEGVDKKEDDDRPASPLDLGEKDGWGDEGIVVQDEKVKEEVEKEQHKEIEKDNETDETTKTQEQQPKVESSETQPEIEKEEIQLEEKEEKDKEVKEIEKEEEEEKEDKEEKEEIEEKEEKEEEREEEQQEEEEEEGGLDAEFVQKYNDLITQNEKLLRENKLMRQEVVKLHEEIQSQSTKSRATAEALSQMTEVLSEHQKKAHEKDKQVIKLKQQEQELETALHAKDMQIAGSRAQFEQVEKTLRMREATLTQYQERIEKLIQEKEDLLDGNQRANFQIQNKVDELDKLMQDEKRTYMDGQRQAKERETELQAGLAEYTKALALTQRNLDEKTLEYQRTTAALKEAQNESKTLRQELVDYKLRATKVLQSKEKAIQEMTERLSTGGGGGEGGSVNSLAELVRVQQEHDVLQQERDDLSRTVEQLRNNLQDVQTQAEADSEVYHTQLAASEEALERERKRVQTLQIDLLTRSNESVSMQGEAEKSLSEAKEGLKTKDAEIARLKKQLASKSQSSSSQMELENRLRSTTDHLLQKQAQIDTLLSEKSFLQLQLENTIQRERHSSKSDHIPINIKSSDPIEDEHEEPRIRQRPIASLVPVNQPNFVSQRVVRAANFLDTMSASAGRVMRIYPGARLAVIAYVFMIHLMGFYILASWNPEVHAFEEDTPPTG